MWKNGLRLRQVVNTVDKTAIAIDAAWDVQGVIFGFHGEASGQLYNPRHPNTSWEDIWTPKHLLRRPLGVPNTSSQGIWRILED